MGSQNRLPTLDLDALLQQIDQLNLQKSEQANSECTQLIQTAYQTIRHDLAAQFEQSAKPKPYLKGLSKATDQIIQAILHAINIQLGCQVKDHVSVCAVGGYGRSQLFPYSDVDLLFLYEEKNQKSAERIAQLCLYYLWDLKCQIGHAVRTPKDAINYAKSDHTIAANLLDARLVDGSKKIYKEFDQLFEKQIRGQDKRSFVTAKLEERRARHAKHGNSRFVLEPNIKENKGALRDLHTLHWLACYCYHANTTRELVKQNILTDDEHKQFKRAEEFLNCVRIYLHLLSERAEERLTFDMQKMIGEKLDYRTSNAHRPVERFMKRYFQVAKSVGDLTRTFCAILEEENVYKAGISLFSFLRKGGELNGFVLDGDRLNFAEQMDIESEPHWMLSIFLAAQTHGYDIHPQALQRISRNLKAIDKHVLRDPEVNDIFLAILLHRTNPEVTLRRLSDSGVLGRFIPDFARVTGQMQYDMYHVYTVDEHTIRAIGILHNVESGQYKDELPLATSVVPHITSREVLYLALLCHDIAKGRGGNHEAKGAKIAMSLAKRMGYSESDAKLCSWLVEYSMLFSDVAFKRDLSDPKTIKDFVAIVQSPVRMRLLLLLSVADIRAVGPNLWNGWKGSLLRELYLRAEDEMGVAKEERSEQSIAEFKQAFHKAASDLNETEREHYLDNAYTEFLLTESLEQHCAIASLLKDINDEKKPFGYAHMTNRFLSITNLIICTAGHSHLLANVSGATAMIGASIQGAKIFQLKDGMAVVIIDIQTEDGEAFEDTEKLNMLSTYMHQVADGSVASDDSIQNFVPKRIRTMRSIDVPISVYIDNAVSENYTVIEVNGPDRLGFLHDVANALAGLKLTVASARVTTYGAKAVDVFYVKNHFGFKIVKPENIEYIKQQITSYMTQQLMPKAS